jgi:hypothetical protein
MADPKARVTFTPAIWALLALWGGSCVTVGPGEVAVVWTPGGMSDKVYTEGQHGIGWFDKTQIYDARSQTRDEQLEVLASNGLRITLDTSVRYRIIPEQAVQLEEQLGPHYYSILIGPTIRSQARRVVGRYTPEEIYSTQREAIEREIREGVEKAIAGRHIVLEAVLIRNVALPRGDPGTSRSRREGDRGQGDLRVRAAGRRAPERFDLEMAADSGTGRAGQVVKRKGHSPGSGKDGDAAPGDQVGNTPDHRSC